MNQAIAESLAHAILDHLGPRLSQFFRHKLYHNDNELELLVKEREDSNCETILIRLTIAEHAQEIHISNIFMPEAMKKQGIGKSLIAQIYEVAKAHEYRLLLVQMTGSFFARMRQRGAKVIEEDDCVEITDETDLKPNA